MSVTLRSRRQASLNAVMTLAALVVTLLAIPAARAQAPTAPNLRIAVTHLDGVVGPGAPQGSADADLRLAIDNMGDDVVDNLRVVVEVHPRARSRGLLRAALDRDVHTVGASWVTERLVRDGAELAPGDIAGIALTLDGAAAGWTSTSGVHPVAISLVRGTLVLDRLVTSVVHLAERPPTSLDTVLVVPLDDAPWRLAVDEFPPDVDGAILPGGRIDRLVRGLESVPEAPIALAPSAHLLEDLVDRADGFTTLDGLENPRHVPESAAATRANGMLQRIRTVASGRAVAPVATPYGGVDLGLLATASGDISDIASDGAASANDRVEELLGREPDGAVGLLSDATGDAGLSLLSSRTLIVSWSVVVGPELSLDATLSSPVRQVVTVSGRQVSLLVGDPYIEQLLEDPADVGPVVAAQRVLAETALVHLESPGRAGRPLIILFPRNADLPDDMAAHLFTGLARAPWLTLTDPETVREGAVVDPANLRSVPAEPGLPDDLTESLESTSQLVDGLDRTLVRTGEVVIDPQHLRDDLARASSVWLRDDPAARRRGVARVRTAAEAALGTIEVAAAAGITLTAEEGTIPITLRRPAGVPLDVRVSVDANGRLGWPAGNRSEPIRLTAGEPQTVSFLTVARTRGTFPLVVRVTDPSGQRLLHEATISVRSTAISGPAVAILASVVLLLVVVGLIRRRPPAAPLRAVQDLPATTSGGEH